MLSDYRICSEEVWGLLCTSSTHFEEEHEPLLFYLLQLEYLKQTKSNAKIGKKKLNIMFL